jgi:hypothetical protein
MLATSSKSSLQWNRSILPYLGGMTAGVVLVGVAGLISNATIERMLLRDPVRTLGWGTTLFRILLAGHGLALLLLTSVVWQRCLRTDKSIIPPMSHGTARVLPQTDRRGWGVLFGLSLLALALRLWRLDADLWFDEVLTLLDFVRPPLGEILTSFPSQNQHMFYSVLAHLSVGIFGESAWALRLPSDRLLPPHLVLAKRTWLYGVTILCNARHLAVA